MSDLQYCRTTITATHRLDSWEPWKFLASSSSRFAYSFPSSLTTHSYFGCPFTSRTQVGRNNFFLNELLLMRDNCSAFVARAKCKTLHGIRYRWHCGSYNDRGDQRFNFDARCYLRFDAVHCCAIAFHLRNFRSSQLGTERRATVCSRIVRQWTLRSHHNFCFRWTRSTQVFRRKRKSFGNRHFDNVSYTISSVAPF